MQIPNRKIFRKKSDSVTILNSRQGSSFEKNSCALRTVSTDIYSLAVLHHSRPEIPVPPAAPDLRKTLAVQISHCMHTMLVETARNHIAVSGYHG